MKKQLGIALTYSLILLAGLVAGYGVLSDSSPASGASSFFPKTWPSDKGWAFGKLRTPHSGSTAKTTMQQADNGWNATSGAWFDFIYYGENGSIDWTGNACTMPSAYIWVISRSISGGAGIEYTCSSGSTMQRSTILLDTTGHNWNLDQGSAASGQLDLMSVLVHEFGHAAGWTTHLTIGCSGSSSPTMCAFMPLGTTYRRSLESSDRNNFANAY